MILKPEKENLIVLAWVMYSPFGYGKAENLDEESHQTTGRR